MDKLLVLDLKIVDYKQITRITFELLKLHKVVSTVKMF